MDADVAEKVSGSTNLVVPSTLVLRHSVGLRKVVEGGVIEAPTAADDDDDDEDEATGGR